MVAIPFKPENANDIEKLEGWAMGSTIPEMLQARYLFSGCAYGLGFASHANFCLQDIAPPGTVHSRFKTGSAYTRYLLQ